MITGRLSPQAGTRVHVACPQPPAPPAPRGPAPQQQDRIATWVPFSSHTGADRRNQWHPVSGPGSADSAAGAQAASPSSAMPEQLSILHDVVAELKGYGIPPLALVVAMIWIARTLGKLEATAAAATLWTPR